MKQQMHRKAVPECMGGDARQAESHALTISLTEHLLQPVARSVIGHRPDRFGLVLGKGVNVIAQPRRKGPVLKRHRAFDRGCRSGGRARCIEFQRRRPANPRVEPLLEGTQRDERRRRIKFHVRRPYRLCLIDPRAGVPQKLEQRALFPIVATGQ